MFEIADDSKKKFGAVIKVIGVGGGGCNAVNTMITSGLQGVEYIVANTDAQALHASLATTKVQLGSEITKGLGAGANPEIGRKAALEDYEKLSEVLSGSDMVFITAGMGGGTGTGAAPVIAKLAKEIGALTVGVVTKPFGFEGKKRARHAEMGIKDLADSVDSLITIPNQRLLNLAGENLSLVDTFKKADGVLVNAVQGISDLINNTGLINADFADVSTVMKNKGLALMGTGIASGPDRAIKAATEAISSPLLEDITVDGATGIIINITGDKSLTASEANEAVTLIMEAADEDAEIIFGTVIDENMGDCLKVTVIATGLNNPDKTTFINKVAENTYQQQDRLFAEEVMSFGSRNDETHTAKMPAQAMRVNSEQMFHANNELNEIIPPRTIQENRTANSFANSFKDAAHRNEQIKAATPSMEKSFSIPNVAKEDFKEISSKTKSIAEKLGFMNFDENEFDKPSYLRKEGNTDSLGR